ncbi:hypothetical protein GCM10025879_05330 [Leuconostoc litchii]|uniref:Uncharacterized protein n=1 Tax=Leuconostoc litchii TaxID=1981069 RepID=A0A6P2CN46_9LACO|nr:hypothetical protein [Leuconostoc litchii]TYC47296.1 hypothetical protein ESZ47_03925 [Leuconostoc litchii]GMA69287.1 hypothetical protein GCM10025879_05330 [Leuconostoc litchii]
MNFDSYSYSQQLKKDLDLFQRWQVLVELLSEADQAEVILDITKKILAFDVHQSEMVRVANEHWYPSTHWITVAFSKLAQMASLSSTAVILPKMQKVVEIHFEEFPNAAFRFTKAPLAAGGYYLEEISQDLRVAYWDLLNKRFYLDTVDFMKLVQTEALQIAGVDALTAFQKRLTAIVVLLEKSGYAIDITGLDAEHNNNLIMQSKDISAEVLDALFVGAAKQNFVLTLLKNKRDGVTLNIGAVSLEITQQYDNQQHAVWQYDIIDSNKCVTIYTLFQQLPFFARWYTKWFNEVGLKDKRAVFVD